MRLERPPTILNITNQEIFVRWHIRRLFRAAVWLGPVVALSGWVGSAALPPRAADGQVGPLCSAGSAAARTVLPEPRLVRKVRVDPGVPVQTVSGMPPVLDSGNLYSGTAPDRLSPAAGGAL